MKNEHTMVRGAVRVAALFLGVLGAILGAGLVLSGCSDAADNPVPGPGGPASPTGRSILRVALEAEIDVLNPLVSHQPTELQLALLEGLVTVGEDDSWVPVLAREIPTVENGGIVLHADGTVDMTWHLQSGVTWHDGEPFTGRDVCFTWQFIADPESGARNREHYLGILECTTPDDTTVVLHWDGPYSYWTGLFDVVLPAHVFDGMSAAEVASHAPFNEGRGFIGNGAFRFAEWRSGESLRVVRNDTYWRGPEFPTIDQVVFSFRPGPTGRLTAMKEGRYHWARLLPTQESEGGDAAGFRVHHPLSQTVTLLEFDATSQDGAFFFVDQRVRTAIFESVDLREIVGILMDSTVTPATSLLPPSHPLHNPDVEPLEFDPTITEQKLFAMNWLSGPEGVRQFDGQRLVLNLPIPEMAPNTGSLIVVLRSQLDAVGVGIFTPIVPEEDWAVRRRAGEFQAVITSRLFPPDAGLTPLLSCDGSGNLAGFCDPELDALLLASDRILDPEERRAALAEVQLKVAEAARALPLYYAFVPELVSERIGNFRGGGAHLGSLWNLWEWTLN